MALSTGAGAESLPLTARTSSDSKRSSSPTRASQTLSPLHTSPNSPDRAPDAFNGRSTVDDGSDDDGRVSEDHDQDTVGEGSPMLQKWGGGPRKDSQTLEDDSDDREELLRLDSDDEDDLSGATPSGTLLGGQWESTAIETDSPNLWSESRLTRGQKRRVYGGGRHGDAMEGGGMTAGEVAGLVLAGT